MKRRLNVYTTGIVKLKEGETCISSDELLGDIKQKCFKKYMHVYDVIVIHCKSFHKIPRRFVMILILKLFSKQALFLVDNKGNKKKVGFIYLLFAFFELFYELLAYRFFLKYTQKRLSILESKEYKPSINEEGIPYYIRNDYIQGFIAGGSIGHIAGIVNNINKLSNNNICMVTSDYIPTVDPDIIENVVDDCDKILFSNLREAAGIYYNKPVAKYLKELRFRYAPSFIYHRSAFNAYSAIEFAIENNAPYILEFNGSEVWIRKNWGGAKLETVALSEQIERLALEKATLIVCVSKPLKEQLVEQGYDEKKIIVVPNGVDTEKYTPEIDGAEIRQKLGISKNSVVVGFIGTFGAWHGTDVLAKAAAEVLSLTDKEVRFLLIGDGIMYAKTKEIIDNSGVADKVILTGTVPQEEGRKYLAACDILVSPTVRNPDGTPFFGSPTKLFEYMAMGKAIVVSNMDQMSEICEDEKTALMPEPNDISGLTEAILRLIGNPSLRKMLGENAREEVCNKYTWAIQTQKILNEFMDRCS